MILNELFRNPKLALSEGGNLELPNPDDPTTPYQADEIDLKVHNRTFMVGLLDKLLHDVNAAFYGQYKKPIWNPALLQSKEFLGGSSLHFFNTTGISDKEFAKHKPKVGDIDTQCNKELEPELREFLTSYNHKPIGDATLLGFTQGNEQLNALFQFQDPPIKIQIDFELGRYDTETDMPDEWYRFSHSSEWNDIQAGIKGVFHKYIYRALTAAHGSIKHQVNVLKTKTNIKPDVDDNDLSFAVASGQGGGLSQKYEPYIHTDPTTGEKMTHQNNVPYKRLIPAPERTYIQQLDKQFYYFFGANPEGNDKELQKSFLGALELINKYIPDQAAKEKVFMSFLNLCFEPGAQMITKGDPQRDQEIKFAAIDNFIKICKVTNLRKTAIDMGKAYIKDFEEVEAFRKANPNEKQPRAAMKKQGLREEAQVKAQFRKGMPHLHDLKPADLLDLLDEIHDGNGNFKLENIPLNVKVDGFGGRFGKNSEGKPFMGTSRTEPRYEPGFVAYHQKKGTTDPEVLGRAELFDQLFEEMMNAVKLVDSKLGPGFLVNKQVTCEVLYLPFATETDEGKLKFVGIHYDKLPSGVKLALVPFHITDATTGDTLPNGNQIVKELTSAGRMGSVMFIDNSLTQNEALDVTALVPPVENIDELKAMLASNKLEARRQVKAALEPVAAALEKAIINDPNIIGKDLLGQDYEGIVINSRLGPIKVTSQEQRDVITAKNAAKVNARTERPRGEAKTAVVAIGSFVGHIGHEQLFDYTVKKAAAVGGDPYLFIGNAQGKDDPIPPPVKVQTWHKLYPEYAKNISTVTQDGGSLIQKIKHELINPLPGKPPRYDNVIIMVGEDQAGLTMPQALMKAVNKFQGYEHVKVTLEPTPRGTGMSFTRLRNILADPNATPDQQFAEWAKGFDVNKLGAEWIKHLMDITRKGMGIQQAPAPVPQPEPAPIAEQRVLNALVEGTSIDSTLRAIINDIGEPITSVYDTMKFQAKKYMENHGELGRGFRMVAAGVGGRWVQNMYIGRLHNELHDLCKYNTRRTVDLRDFLRGEEADGELEMKRSFGNLASNLPPILAKLGEQINAPQLTRNARRWMQNKAEYERYLMDLEAESNDELDDEPTIKPPKSNVVGQQNAQVDQIVNDILSKIPKHIAGEIRNAIARSPNKLSALKQELNKHHVTMSEDNAMGHMAKNLTGHGSPIAKAAAQRDKKREQQSTQSHGRAEGPKWNVAEEEIEKNHWYDAGVKDATRGARPNPRTYLPTLKDKQAKHPEEVYFYMNGYKSVKPGVAEGSSYNIDQDDHDEFTPDEIVRIKNSHFPDTLRDNLRAAKKEARRAKHFSSSSDGGDSKLGSPVGSASDNTYESVAEARMSAAQRLWNAEQKQRAKSDASLARTPSSIPKPEPKKDEKIAEKQRLDPSCWKGYRKQGTKMKGDTRVNNCVKVSENVENIMDALINKIIVNEATNNTMRANEVIIEAVGGNYLYHGVPQGGTVSAIIKSGFIKPQPVFDFDRNPNDDSEEANPPVISLSRDQTLRFPYGDAVAQFVIDKDALTRAGIIVKPKVGTGAGRSESEERAYKPIPIKAPYIVAIQYDPKLKVPKPILDYAQQLGIRMEPWKSIKPHAATDDNQNPKIAPATEYTDPNALKLKSQDWFGDIVWTISYDKGTSGNIIQPYYMVKDEIAVKKAYAAIKDRIAKSQSFDDLLPQGQYGKTWSQGKREIKPGDRGYKP